MRYSCSPADGHAITLDDLAAFVAEMKEYRELPGHTQVRAMGVIELDMQDGPRISRITADTDPPAGPNRQQRRAAGQRGPKR